MDHDIANIRTALLARSPILLVGDIDRGGVFASLEGTLSIMKRHNPAACALVKGFVINKFRGNSSSLKPALHEVTKVTNIPVLGVVPFLHNLHIAQEDTVGLEEKNSYNRSAVLDTVVIHTPALQNSSDFDALLYESGMNIRFIAKAADFGKPDIVILGGSKQIISDLLWLRKNGIAQHILEHAKKGGSVIGICGGFQMLGMTITDPEQYESDEKEIAGLGLLPVTTRIEKEKITCRTTAVVTADRGLLKGAGGLSINGYEIHMGKTSIHGQSFSVLNSRDGKTVSRPEGSVAANGWILGTYLHDLFKNDSLRKHMVQNSAEKKGVVIPKGPRASPEYEYDRLANAVREHIDMDLFYRIISNS
jgi:adenosylcobyric acid synthase